MPEIPEIETVRSQLENSVLHKQIVDITIARPKTINLSVDDFTNGIVGQTFIATGRRAKIPLLELSNGMCLFFHFMLEGHVRLYAAGETIEGKPNVHITFSTGEQLSFYRMELGYVRLVPLTALPTREEFSELGPEPLDADFTQDRFHAILSGKKGMIKPLLMDQSFLAGLGNVYSNETLFCGRILPERKASSLSQSEIDRLYQCIRDLLTRAITLGGVGDIKYSEHDTLTGGFTPHLQVAYRTGEPCYVCTHPIETKRVGGRNAFFCPVCQK